MCELDDKYTIHESFTGYKVVAKLDKDYYSLAMGFKYPSDGSVPIPKEQEKISGNFNSNILTSPSDGYREDMVGRTAAYIDPETPQHEKVRISYEVRPPFKTVVVKVTLSKDLMAGTYGQASVVAGKHIKIEEEMPNA